MKVFVDRIRSWSVPARRLRRGITVLGLAGTLVAVNASSANAAAFTYSVYAPKRLNSYQLQGWGNLSRDCSGTYGCSNYIKIERSRWYGAEFIGGSWANAHGWNSITVNLPSGCFHYRTTVDSYNDVVATSGFGVNVGRIGFTKNGTSINRYKQTWSSGWAWHCR
jgi:hypothetical protein